MPARSRPRPRTPLQKAREARGLTFQALADAVGLDHSTLVKIEQRLHGTRPSNADRLAKFLGNGLTRDQILFPNDYMDQAN